MALYSENNDVVLDSINKRLELTETLSWSVAKRLGIPIWVKSHSQLLSLIEKLAKNEYKPYKGIGIETKA